MSRTARCLFAIGLSASLAAACGDDDTIDTGSGGSGGSGGRAGTAGTAGTGGIAGTAGTGTGGTNAGGDGSGGTGTAGTGTGGTGTAGTGTGGTTGTVEPGDAGPDAADGGDVLTDAGAPPRACPDDLDVATAGAFSSDGTQNVIITRVVFRNGGADVTFRAQNADFNFADPMTLCTGSENGDCDDGVAALVENPDGGAGTDLAEDEEVTYFTTGVNPVAGELALVNGAPTADGASIVFAYIAWGNFVSAAPTAPGNSALPVSLDARAADEGNGRWTLGERIDVGSDSTIFATGDVTTADDFNACTADN